MEWHCVCIHGYVRKCVRSTCGRHFRTSQHSEIRRNPSGFFNEIHTCVYMQVHTHILCKYTCVLCFHACVHNGSCMRSACAIRADAISRRHRSTCFEHNVAAELCICSIQCPVRSRWCKLLPTTLMLWFPGVFLILGTELRRGSRFCEDPEVQRSVSGAVWRENILFAFCCLSFLGCSHWARSVEAGGGGPRCRCEVLNVR